MKRTMYKIILAVIVIMDIYLILKVAYYRDMPLKAFWVYHLILTGGFWIINEIFFKRDINYFDVLIILFPGVGFSGLFFLDILPERESHYSEVEETLELRNYIKGRRELEYIDVSAELGMIGAYDRLYTGSSREKKKFLMSFNPPELSFKVEVLKKALLDEDIDVIHYAATELNRIDETLQEEIFLGEMEGKFEEVFHSYMKYIRSGLLEGEILKFYQEGALELLEKFSEGKFLLEELNLLKDTFRLEACQVKVERLLDADPSLEIIEFAMRFYHERNHYGRVLELKNKFPEEAEEISQGLLQYGEGVA
ncbi:hypothetical protein PM10SUCC1_21990 [Propionigenium maris DSM 9537]|uniref:Uncharacterized protein n=1 Tax=Propionigenium maris DSM 9537 TaxID=1123000 RepID=A0A9W6GMJ6_9FUSO|nr:hypothetical protein [Propionigenium maris]GLI56685.1 hypothetical protein PM10SUCC1_21990 [Propionigenium maris DSM 9537]